VTTPYVPRIRLVTSSDKAATLLAERLGGALIVGFTE